MTQSKIQNLQKFLQTSGQALTAKQIRSQFKIQNPRAAVTQLRSAGICVYSNAATLSTGEKVTKYRVGKPTKAMVAAAYATAGGELFAG